MNTCLVKVLSDKFLIVISVKLALNMLLFDRAGPKPRMPVKAGGAARAASEAGSGAAGDSSDPNAAPLLPQPLRLKYSVGKIIGM